MAWVKLDDQFFFNHKVLRAGRDARDLYLAALAYCNAQLTDGYVASETLPLLGVMAGVANPEQSAKQLASKLVEVCLWETNGNGYQVHDYLEYNPSKEKVLETRRMRAEVGAQGGRAKSEGLEQSASKLLSKPLAKAEQNSSKSLPPSPSPLKSEEKTGDEASPAHAQPTPPVVKPPSPKPKRSEAVLAFQEIMHRLPNAAQMIAIDARVTVEAVPRWREAVTAWAVRGNKPTNVDGMLDWFKKGVPEYVAKPPANGGPGPPQRMSNVERSLQACRNVLARDAEQRRMEAEHGNEGRDHQTDGSAGSGLSARDDF